MKKTTAVKIASLATLGMVPMMMWSQDGQAIPAFARKYQTSCYTCHAGFPARNAFGEAFKANGYRWPGGEDEDHAKQEQTKMGSEGWKKTFPSSPWPTDIPGFAPLAFFVTGPLFNHADAITNKAGTATASTKPAVNNWGGPFDARILYGGTIGEHIGFFGAFEGFAASGTNIKSRFRGTWSFAPGVLLGVGNAFSFWQSGEDEPTFTSTLPATTGTGLELSIAQGEKSGGWRLYLGTQGNGTDAATLSSTTTLTHVDDIRYARFEYKIGGAGVLSGAGGKYGNEYIGLDNSLEFGASIVNTRDGLNTTLNPTSFGYNGNNTSYAFDVTGNYGSFTGGAAWGRGVDNDLAQWGFDVGYFIYPWLQAKVAYRHLEAVGPNWKSGGLGKGPEYSATANLTNPTYTFTVTAWPTANFSIAAAYKLFEKEWNPTTTGFVDAGVLSNANTFTLTTALAF